MAARFDYVPVVEVSADNFSEVWPSMVRAIKKSSFVALDTEMSGIGERKNLMAQFVEDRYKYMCEVAQSRAILSLGISCFKLKKSKSSNDTKNKEGRLNIRVKTFNIVVLCTENFVVEPASLTFLVGHGFDFNKQYAKGVPYSRGNDKELSNASWYTVRNLFNQLVLANKPLVLHNGFLDLVFLYENFYCKLPDKLQVFTADLSEMFPAGVFDTKFVSEHSVREPASFLLYLFKKCQRNNLQHQKHGAKHVCLKFPEETSLSGFTEELYCGSHEETEAVHIDVIVCEKFAAYGFCPREKTCPLSHDVDDVLDREWKIKEAKRQKRKRKHRTSSGNNEPDVSLECDNDNAPTMETLEDSCTHDAHDAHVTQPRDVHATQSNNVKTRDCGHRAGFDAFMTGYCMATYLLQLGKKGDDNELTLSSLVDISNKLSLTKKDVPLQIVRSHFIRPSASHSEKLKRLKEQLVSGSDS
ncbi:hypothetical protein ACROYT_G043371 [Oculina patagonica]